MLLDRPEHLGTRSHPATSANASRQSCPAEPCPSPRPQEREAVKPLSCRSLPTPGDRGWAGSCSRGGPRDCCGLDAGAKQPQEVLKNRAQRQEGERTSLTSGKAVTAWPSGVPVPVAPQPLPAARRDQGPTAPTASLSCPQANTTHQTSLRLLKTSGGTNRGQRTNSPQSHVASLMQGPSLCSAAPTNGTKAHGTGCRPGHAPAGPHSKQEGSFFPAAQL